MMAYCNLCSRLIEHIITPSRFQIDADYKKWELEKDCDFKDSMPQCALCKYLYQALEVLFEKQTSTLDREGKLRKILLFNRYGYRCHNGEPDSPLCRVDLNFPSVGYRPVAYFAVWAETGNPAAATITTQPPVHKDESEIDQICALVHNRLYDCITTHSECVQSNTSGTEPRLPTRVLYVKNATSCHNSVRLVQTRGETGAYCALSHCWGPVDRQPIRTLAGNIQEHYSGIPLTSLPRTFQEAVILTAKLGIDYLWIDSLCIQQDDEDDWRREAASMGPLYQHATLVIGASEAEDPTGGLLTCERSPKTALELPYVSNGKKHGGTFNLAFRGPFMRPLEVHRSPLQERAWALQESYLSRRMVLFTGHGVNWRCITCQCDECGCYADLGLYEHHNWLTLLEAYSNRNLTWPSDRLPALQGIVDDESKRRDDTFLSEGVWEKEITEHLLWYRGSILTHGDTALPSWSWAATEGSKDWICRPVYGYELQYDHNCAIIQRSEPAHLSVSGDLVQGDFKWAEMKVCCIRRCQEYLVGKEGPPLYLATAHLLQIDAGILGFAKLDQDEEPSSSNDHSTLKFCILSKMRTSEISEKPDIAFPEISPRCFDDCIDIWQEFRNIDYVLWALVLEPVADTKETYTRVGLAMLFPLVQTAGYCRPACFTIK